MSGSKLFSNISHQGSTCIITSIQKDISETLTEKKLTSKMPEDQDF